MKVILSFFTLLFLSAPSTPLFADEIESAPTLTVSPKIINFGRVKIGGYGFNQQTVHVRNQGQVKVDVRVSGYCGPHYSVGNSCYSLNPASSCRIQIDFRPRTPGTHRCTVTVRGSDGSYNNVNIQGAAYR